MIGYVTLGTNNLEAASVFYDALLAEIGAARFMQNDRMVAWGIEPDKPMLAAIVPFDEQPATAGNGTMVALSMDSPEAVQKLHAKAIQLGAQDEGAPGPRGDDGNFYGGYFRDMDGNKLVAFCM
jgi:predicted lactoylglutathione lyase